MRVELKQKWFAPTLGDMGDEDTTKKRLIFSMSGQRYRPGVHTMPDEFREHLPSHAIILDEGAKHVPVKADREGTLSGVDFTHQAEIDARIEALTEKPVARKAKK